jgi:F-type H+-transporting ATPase subunit b
MGTIYTILNSLKIDQSFYIQFTLFVVFFNILAPLLFKKIQNVLELRESKTVKLDSHANHLYKQVEDLAQEYKGSVEKTHQDSQSIASKKKAEILSKEREEMSVSEEKMSNEYETKKSAQVNEFSEKSKVIMAEASVLSDSLVAKLTK